VEPKVLAWLERHGFEGRVLPVDRVVMGEWAELYARHQRAGRLLSSFDGLLAATATVQD
jgi:predicted nucleic acid-binding protein